MEEIKETVPYLCPVCNGCGHVSGGFYLSIGHSGTAMATTEVCRSCNGLGIIYSTKITTIHEGPCKP